MSTYVDKTLFKKRIACGPNILFCTFVLEVDFFPNVATIRMVCPKC